MQRKIVRVLHVIKTLSLGGAESNLLNLACALDAEKVETHLAYSFGGELEGRFLEAGVKLFKYADRSNRVKSLQTIPIVARLASYVQRNRIDIVHTHNFNAHIWGLVAAKLSRVKVVEHVHDFRYTRAADVVQRHGGVDQYKFIKYFKRQSDQIIVLTKQNYEYVVEHGFSTRDHVIELRNGIPLDANALDHNDTRAQLNLRADDVVVLTTARMDPTKNIDLILRIAERVISEAPRVVFVVAGSGAHLAEYVDRSRELGLERHVRFIGYQADVYPLLAAADVFLLPSFLELHSIAILEALKMKLPVVVSAGVGCNSEFIRNGINGFLCDPFRDEPWISALLQLVRDAELRKNIAMRGHDMCRKLFDIRHAARRIEAVYSQLLQQR